MVGFDEKFYITIIVLITLISLVYVFQQTENIKLGYKIDSMTKCIERIKNCNTELELIISKFKSLSYLDTFAQKYGFVIPPKDNNKNLFLYKE